MSRVAALTPPPGINSNFTDPSSTRNTNLICQAICLSLSTIVVCMRLYTRSRITRNFAVEDYLICIAWLGLLAYGALLLDSDNYGSGVHEWNVTKAQQERWALLFNIDEIIYGPIILATKASILLLYLNVFHIRRKSWTHFLLYFILGFNLLFYTAITLVKIFECTPRPKIWDKSIQGHCINLYKLLLTTGTVNVCSDIAILVLPIGCVSQLQMAVFRKIAICAVFTAGLFAPIASGVRLAKTVTGTKSPDATWNMLPVLLWAEAEVTTGIVVGCLPILPALFRYYFPKLFTQSSEKPARSSVKLNNNVSNSRYLRGGAQYNISMDDYHLLDAESVELADRKTWRHDADRGPKIKVEGEIKVTEDSTSNENEIGHGSLLSDSQKVMNGQGILRTVRVETETSSIQPLPQTHHAPGIAM